MTFNKIDLVHDGTLNRKQPGADVCVSAVGGLEFN